MKNIKLIALILLIGVATISCKKDKENPVITVNEPSNHAHLKYGAELHIEATFTDDRDLKHYHVWIGNEAGIKSTDFDFEKHGDISGKSYDFHEHKDIPTGIGMVYYIHFEVEDKEGKKAETKVMIHLED